MFLCLSDLNNVVHKYTFNSVSFTLIPFIDPHAVLPGNSLYLSVKDNAGNLWFSDDDSPTKIIKYDGIWNSIPINQYLSVVNTIKKDPGSSIILGGSSIGLLNGPIILNDTTFKSLDPTNTIVGTVQDIAIDNNHHYWCLMTNELIDWHNGIATSHYIATYHQANIFDIDSIGNKWVGIDSVFSSPGIGYGVLILNNLSNWSHFYSGNSPLPDDSIIQIVREGNSNKMWICTRNGFARYWNGNWTIYNTSNTPLPSNHAENVYLDTNDSTLWFSTMEGFASLKGGVWNVYSPFNSPCHYSDIESIVVDNNCTLWAATAGGLTSARLPCGQSLGINVSGIVNKSDNTPAQNTMVYIYKLNNNRTDVVQVDNVFTDNLGNYTYYTTDTGKYYFEANVNISQYPNQMIAYHDSSLVIQQTQALNLISNGNYTANIKLKQIVSSLGGCTFNGKLSSSTERIGSVRLILMLNGQPVASTLSNVDGSFKFQNIAPVTYTIWVDKLGLNNSVAPSVTIDCANNNSTYPLTLFSDHLSLGPVNIASNIISNSINIYPNPFTSTTTVEFSEEQKNTTIIIIDVVGKKIKSETFSGKQYILEKGTMQSGIYFVQITDENKNVVNRKIVVE